MNPFENNPQSKRNDALDSGVGFIASFTFFAIVFITAVIVDFVTL